MELGRVTEPSASWSLGNGRAALRARRAPSGAPAADGPPNAVYRLAAKGTLAKPVKHQHGGLQLEDVEAASLQRYRLGRGHPYWCRGREAAEILGINTTRVQQLTVRDGSRSSSTVGDACTAAPSSG